VGFPKGAAELRPSGWHYFTGERNRKSRTKAHAVVLLLAGWRNRMPGHLYDSRTARQRSRQFFENVQRLAIPNPFFDLVDPSCTAQADKFFSLFRARPISGFAHN